MSPSIKSAGLQALAFLALTMASIPSARAEGYLGAFAGAAVPEASDLKATALEVAVKAQAVRLHTSPAFGGKLGYWFGAFPYVGIEVEAYRRSPDASAQTVSLTADGEAAGTEKIGKMALQVTTIGFSLMARVPLDRFQPYWGAGPAIFMTRFKDTGRDGVSIVIPPGQKDTDTRVGVQALAGLKFFVTAHIALFAEYKFTSHTLDVRLHDEFLGRTDVTARLKVHHAVGGLAYHF